MDFDAQGEEQNRHARSKFLTGWSGDEKACYFI